MDFSNWLDNFILLLVPFSSSFATLFTTSLSLPCTYSSARAPAPRPIPPGTRQAPSCLLQWSIHQLLCPRLDLLACFSCTSQLLLWLPTFSGTINLYNVQLPNACYVLIGGKWGLSLNPRSQPSSNPNLTCDCLILIPRFFIAVNVVVEVRIKSCSPCWPLDV